MTTLEKKVDLLVKLSLCENTDMKRAILKSIKDVDEESTKSPTTPAPVDYHSKVVKTLLELGTPDRVVGHKYLAHSIELVIENPDLMGQITSVLYPEVAKKFNTTASRVERAIRHAIEITWDRVPITVMEKYFGNTVSALKGKPTNSEFISRMANELR